MADVMFNCMFCNESLIVDEQGVGLEVPCPYCLHKMEIPDSAVRVDDPASIIEVEAPEPPPEDPNPNLVGVVDEPKGLIESDASPSGLDLEELSSDNAETVLALLGSLLDEADKLEADVGLRPKAHASQKAAPLPEADTLELGSADTKVIQAIEDLRSRIDHLQTAYSDAGHKVDELSSENSELRNRIQHEEHEREDLAAKLVHYTQKIEVDAILNELENSHVAENTPHPRESATTPEPLRPKWGYPVSAALLCLLALVLLIALYKVTVGNDGRRDAQLAGVESVQVKNILLGDSSYLDGIRMIAYEARIASADSMGIKPEQLNGAEHCLVINITLQNTKVDKNVYLAKLWEESRLYDDLGNRLKRLAYRVTREGDDDASDPVKVVLKPTEMADTVIIFEAPVSSAKTFVMNCQPGFWLEAPDGYEPVTENPFSLKFNRTEIAVAANK